MNICGVSKTLCVCVGEENHDLMVGTLVPYKFLSIFLFNFFFKITVERFEPLKSRIYVKQSSYICRLISNLDSFYFSREFNGRCMHLN